MKPFFVLLTSLVLIGCGESSPEDSIVQLGGLVERDDTGEITMVCLNDLPITDAEMEYVKGLTSLEVLWLDDSEITDTGLLHLAQLTNLKELRLDGTQITDAGVANLKQLTSLEKLTLNNTQITGRGVEYLNCLLYTSPSPRDRG